MMHALLDAHVHFWDPAVLEYPWLEEHPAIRRSFRPADYDAAMRGVPVDGIIFVEGNPRPEQAQDEVSFIEELAGYDRRIIGIVAYADLLDTAGIEAHLDVLAQGPLVRGVRHNIQGNPPGFALQTDFVAGVRATGRRGLAFDLCATHDQLSDVVALAKKVDDTTRLVLDHCGKPAIRTGGWEPWATQIRELASLPHVYCKVSGLLMEADPATWHRDEILRYASHVVDCFGTERVMYGSDWPVVTLADRSSDWYPLTQQLTAGWSENERGDFYAGNARGFYAV